MAVCISMSGVTKRYGAATAVDDLSLEVESGEVLGLLGLNGAGKSTTLSMLAGLIRPSAGSISVFGRDRQRQHLDIARRMGVMMERPAFIEHLSVRRNLRLQARLAGKEVSVDRVLDLAGLLDYGSQKAGTLSLGLRQRLGLAQAMLTEPELLLLDEPTTGLDVESTQEVLTLLRRLADEARVTILYSSHLMREVEMLCDRVAILNKGRLVACDRTDALLSYDQTHLEVLLVEGVEGAAKRLTDQPWVEDIEIKPGRLQVRLRGGGAPQVTAFLVNAGYQVAGVIPRRRTLQEYFLKVLNR